MPIGIKKKTPENVEQFVNLVILGVSREEICKKLGIAKGTYYSWLEDAVILGEIEERRTEVKSEGMNFIKGRYKKYLKNIDKLCDNFQDKRVALSANQFMLEKMDGKNVAKIEDVTPESIEITLINYEEND